MTIRTKPQKISGRNSLKRGDGRQAGKDTAKLEKHPNMSNQHYCNPTMATIHEEEVESFQGENSFEGNIEKQAATIRQYSMKKFTEVNSPQGEVLLAYESYTMNIFYYRPGNMMFVAMHTTACDCNMCDWTTKPPAQTPKRTSPRHIPYGHGRRTSGSTQRPRSKTPQTQTSEEPPYSPQEVRTTPPVEDTRWDNLDTTCEWEENPFRPKDETRELNPPRGTVTKNAKYWKDLHHRVTLRIKDMSDVKNLICPGIPTNNHFSTLVNAKDAYLKASRAEGILLQALSGQIPYSAAHQEWTFYRGQCEHGTKFYHASTTCYSCITAETALDQDYGVGWAHVKQAEDA